MTHVRTAPYYPQSNGPASPTSPEEARRLMERFVEYYNGVRLHSAIGYIALDEAGSLPRIISDKATLSRLVW